MPLLARMRSEGSPRPAINSVHGDPAKAAPAPKAARGVKIALGLATALLGLAALAIWGLIRAFGG